ncbi:NAD(P)/FAD-dependent oxidoreductase [Lichenifustis flavocetrariae]|uniref:NAD(P)/FAD-dependent oxidoreductase n=1 Tax=Lichenifustis flavocetrariae TaxID=2949735 RepID=A0AA41YZ18_9HYPH|nr:NAD(P)/FAD-dependent oxidoreductase [Lichenifustis flavocetrariae]MCW6507435.1 NAD(P)/FAD-dependent oxidoreductase [Lichenifustis flavocetrariae]
MSELTLTELAEAARRDLATLAYPATDWVEACATRQGEHVHAVIVVGAGQSGLLAAASLRREGVHDVVVLDRAQAGQEGVWDAFARMEELRSPKALNGLEFGCPNLSIATWYAARHGRAAWEAIERVPRRDWADYLRWYRTTLALAVQSGTDVVGIRDAEADENVLAVETEVNGRRAARFARTVVIATGFDGAGAWRVPDFISDHLPRDRYDHTNGPVDFERLRGRRVAVLGHGASAFDNANAALRAGAARVDLCFRRTRLPRSNPHRHLETAGTMTHFNELDDAIRWQVARHFRAADQPPPNRAFAEALAHPRFSLHPGRPWLSVRLDGDEIVIATPQGALRCDHLLCGTGLAVDLAARPELTSLAPLVALWRDLYTPPPAQEDARLEAFPYLDANFNFLPRHERDGWVRQVFAFNGLSAVSQGPHSTSISGHRHAMPRLVRGVTARLFSLQSASFIDRLKRYDNNDLAVPDDFESAHPALGEPHPSPLPQPARLGRTEIVSG